MPELQSLQKNRGWIYCETKKNEIRQQKNGWIAKMRHDYVKYAQEKEEKKIKKEIRNKKSAFLL